MRLYMSPTEDELGQEVDMGQTGVFSLTGLTNDQTYFLRLSGMTDEAEGDYSDPIAATPKADPDPPSGTILIENGAETTTSKEVTLYISSSDTPLEGVAQAANAHLTDYLSLAINKVSANVEMRLANDDSMDGAAWEPLAAQKAWTLDCDAGEVCTVYAQFRDGAENESFIVFDNILLEGFEVYMPLIIK
jgi:hypothetical protein